MSSVWTVRAAVPLNATAVDVELPADPSCAPGTRPDALWVALAQPDGAQLEHAWALPLALPACTPLRIVSTPTQSPQTSIASTSLPSVCRGDEVMLAVRAMRGAWLQLGARDGVHALGSPVGRFSFSILDSNFSSQIFSFNFFQCSCSTKIKVARSS